MRSDPLAEKVAVRALARLDAVVPRMGLAYRQEIPEYRDLPEATMEREVLQISRRFIEEFLSCLAHGRPVEQPSDLDEMADAGRKRLEMGISLDSALHAFRVAGRVGWEAVVAATRRGEERVLGGLATKWLGYVDRASSAFAEGYVAAAHESLLRVDARRRALLEALLDASGPVELAAVAARFSLPLARQYVPVLLDGDGVSGRIDAVLVAAPADTVAGPWAERLLLLVPERLGDVKPLLMAARATRLAFGLATPGGPGLREEVHHAEVVLAAADLVEASTGAFGPDDLILGQLLVSGERPAAILRARVRDVLDAHDRHAALASTLHSYFECGSVSETARREVVHFNTIVYRLNRVRQLTGLDPRVPEQAAQLVLAMTPIRIRTV